MPEPSHVFAFANSLALLAWVALIAALLAAPIRERVWTGTAVLIPVLLGIVYVVLIVDGFGEAEGGGFGSIAEVRALFASDAGLTAGWLHYLAFDLFVGTWISREGLAAGLPRLLIVPCLVLTFLFGPAGLLLFYALRLALGRRTTEVPA